MEKFYSKVLNIIVSVGIVLTILLLAIIPFVLGALSKSSDIGIQYQNIIVITLGIYICAIPYIAALFDGEVPYDGPEKEV